MSAPLLEVGYVGKAHGLRGEVTIRLTTNRTERVRPGNVLFAGSERLVVAASRPHQERWLVRFESVTDRNGAEALRGETLFAEPIEDSSTLWVHELVGCTVQETDGTVHGVVEALEDNPASDLLVLESGALIPLTFLVEQQGDVLVVETPPGLFDPVDPSQESQSDPGTS